MRKLATPERADWWVMWHSKIYLQLLVLVPLAVLQVAILPRLLPGYVLCNLLTVWVVVSTVLLRLAPAIAIALLAALLLETHSAVPRGLYFCAYGTLVGVLHMSKGLVTWNLRGAWLAVIVSAELWLLLLENIAVNIPTAEIITHSGKYLLRLGGTGLVAYLLLKYTRIATARRH